MIIRILNDGEKPNCINEADLMNNKNITISDLTFLVDYLFANGPAPVACPTK